MAPQITYIIILLINLVLIGNRHGKPKKGENNAFTDIFAMAIQIALLVWGGFFDPLLKNILQ